MGIGSLVALWGQELVVDGAAISLNKEMGRHESLNSVLDILILTCYWDIQADVTAIRRWKRFVLIHWVSS